jgi:Family of unknown function (DUF5677)
VIVPPHSAEAEVQSLKLVVDFNTELIQAQDSLDDKQVIGLVDRYRLWSSKHLQRAVDGFAFLRRSGRVDGSKFLVRPAIEMAFRLQAARLHPDLYYRIAHEEHRQNKHLMQGEPQLLAQIEKNWDQFKNAFVKEFPTALIVDDKLTIECIAEKADMKSYYDSHYRIYCRYTHGALQASTGHIDKATDPADNQIMAVCALVALDNLISLGVNPSNRDRLAQRLKDITSS